MEIGDPEGRKNPTHPPLEQFFWRFSQEHPSQDTGGNRKSSHSPEKAQLCHLLHVFSFVQYLLLTCYVFYASVSLTDLHGGAERVIEPPNQVSDGH